MKKAQILSLFILLPILSWSQFSFFARYGLKSDIYLYPISFGNSQSHFNHTQPSIGVNYRTSKHFELSTQLGYIHKRGLQAQYQRSKNSGGGSSPSSSFSNTYTSNLYAEILTIKIEPTYIFERGNIINTNSQIRFSCFWQLDFPIYQKENKGGFFEYSSQETYPDTYIYTNNYSQSDMALFKIRPTVYTGVSIAQNWYIKNYFIQLQYSCFVSWKSRYKTLFDENAINGEEVFSIPYGTEEDSRKFGSELSLTFGWSDLEKKIIKKK
jgi:hypothetical protein